MPPPARKLRRALSPPAARNVFADGPGDDSASHAAGLLRALPVVARYRCAALAPRSSELGMLRPPSCAPACCLISTSHRGHAAPAHARRTRRAARVNGRGG